MPYLPSPVAMPPLQAPLSVDMKLTFDTGNPVTDRAAELAITFANIQYDQVVTIGVDVGVTERDNDISTPKAAELIPVYKPSHLPADVQVIAILLTCDFGEAALYFATDLSTEEYFDPPDVDAMIPVPLVPGGFLLYVNNHLYEEVNNWQGDPPPNPARVFIGEILAATFLPTRITGYVFLKNTGV